jgi:hypothetical protein
MDKYHVAMLRPRSYRPAYKCSVMCCHSHRVENMSSHLIRNNHPKQHCLHGNVSSRTNRHLCSASHHAFHAFLFARPWSWHLVCSDWPQNHKARAFQRNNTFLTFQSVDIIPCRIYEKSKNAVFTWCRRMWWAFQGLSWRGIRRPVDKWRTGVS